MNIYCKILSSGFSFKIKRFCSLSLFSYKTVFHHFQPWLLGKQNLINKTKITFSLMSLASRTSWSQNVISISLTVYFCSEYKLLNTGPYFFLKIKRICTTSLISCKTVFNLDFMKNKILSMVQKFIIRETLKTFSYSRLNIYPWVCVAFLTWIETCLASKPLCLLRKTLKTIFPIRPTHESNYALP